jgi:hypothetical protein
MRSLVAWSSKNVASVADCGLSCFAEPVTRKIPVRWSGDAPKLEQTVRVAGILSQSEQGLSFVAQEIGIL